MSKHEVSSKLYHGLTIDQFLEHYQAGALRGLSRHRLDNGNGAKGTYLSDDFDYVLENQHGREIRGEGEILDDWSELFKKLGIEGDGKIRQQFYRTRVIAELSDLPNKDKLVPHFLPHQLFYFGDIPIPHISGVYLDQRDDQVIKRDIERLVSVSVPREIIKPVGITEHSDRLSFSNPTPKL